MPGPLVAIPAAVAAAGAALAAVGNVFTNLYFGYELVKKFFPELYDEIVVEAQGAKTTPTSTVVHACLAAAFGTIQQTRFAQTDYMVETDHTRNAVKVTFKSQTTVPLEAVNILVRAFRGADNENVVPNNHADPNRGANGVTVQSWVNDGTGVMRRRHDGDVEPPAVVQNVGMLPPGGVLDTMRGILDTLMKELGPQAMYRIGRETIFGGEAPLTMQAGKGNKPFAEMEKKPILTRKLAENPTAFFGDADASGHDGYGTDLTTLLTQVLHDPGVRPPLPQTHRWPAPVADEAKGV